MKRIKTFFVKALDSAASWFLKDIEDATTNPTSEFEHRLRNQKDRYEKNNLLLTTLIECETRDAEAGYTKWRQVTKTKARIQFFLRLFLIPTFFIGLMTITEGVEYTLILLILLVISYAYLGGYFLYLHIIQPNARVLNYEKHLYYLSSLSKLSSEQIYENLDKKNPANYAPIFRSKLDTQAEIYSFFVSNFELLQKDKVKYYYKPFVDFITNYVKDKDGNRIKVDSCRSAFSRTIESKID